MNTAVIIPTLGRHEQAVKCVAEFLRTSSADVILCSEEPQELYEAALADPRVKFVRLPEDTPSARGWNRGLRAYPDYDAYYLGQDDLWPEADWLNEVLRVHRETGATCIATNDLHIHGMSLGAQYWMTREFIVKHNGGVMACPHYRSWGLDVETNERAKRARTYAWAEHAKVEHRHRIFGAADDATYQKAKPSHYYDQLIMNNRAANGWPDDFPAVIA